LQRLKHIATNRQTNRIVACRSARHVALSINHESHDSE